VALSLLKYFDDVYLTHAFSDVFRMFMFYSIKAKVVTIYSLVMIAFTSMLLLSVFVNERDRLLDLALEKSTEISQMHAKLLSQEFAQYVAMLKIISGDFSEEGNNPDLINALLHRLMTIGNGSFINAIYVDKDFNLTDSNGRTMKEIDPLLLHNIEQVENNPFNISDPFYSDFEEAPIILVTVPILNSAKKWSGVVAVAIPITLLSQRLASIQLAKQSYAWLADSTGLVVAHPRAEFVMKNQLSTTDIENFPGFNKIVQQTKVMDNGYGRYRDAMINEAKIVTFSKVDILPSWTLFVTTKEFEVFRDIYDIIYNVLLISIVLMGLFLILITQLSNKITKPIIRLTSNVKEAVDNNDHQFKRIKSSDEIGELSDAFNDSFIKIQAHREHLEEIVHERTEEVSLKNKLLSEQNEMLEKLVSIDPLTQLYNRRAFTLLVEKELSRAKRHSSSVTLAVLDIDHFKKINDEFGHQAGDEVLKRLASELTNNMRKEDIICRWGGEEFVILMVKTTTELSYNHLDQVREKISMMDFSPVEKLTFSAGMATFNLDEEFKDWFQRADAALYKAKEFGRNQIIKY
jgi:diguanylate cyclase (GGDEF)-like protein